MEKLINDIQNRINMEKLLFSDAKYTRDGIKFIINEYFKVLGKEPYYFIATILSVPKLIEFAKEEGFESEATVLELKTNEWLMSDDYEKESDYYMAKFCYGNALGLPKPESYSSFIQNNMLDVKNVREVFESGYACEFYTHSTEFMLTNNFLLSFYSEFYSMDDLSQLKEIARDRDKNRFAKKEDYSKFKAAANATLKLIRWYEKDHKVKIKIK